MTDALKIVELTKALEEMVCAWDSLPIGTHSNRTINTWLNGDAWRNAITRARAALEGTKA